MNPVREPFVVLHHPKTLTEGYGASALRLIGRAKPLTMDPFVLMDHFTAMQPAGFPDHPHRGFQLLTYCLRGALWHEDSIGNCEVMGLGDAICLTAGKGVLHALIPAAEESCEGIQVWVNLPIQQKMMTPEYVHAPASSLPCTDLGGARLTVVSGSYDSISSPLQTIAHASLLDLQFYPQGTVSLALPPTDSCLLYSLSGIISVGGVRILAGEAAELRSCPGTVEITAEGEGRAILASGKPLGEPIVRYGPFIMSSQPEVMRAAREFNNGLNGFETVDSWRSVSGQNICSL